MADTKSIACGEGAPGLLDVRGVADLLAISSSTVRRLADGGRMPRPVRLGALVRWRRSEVEDWIAAGCPSITKPGRR